jgi:hypothetical protein
MGDSALRTDTVHKLKPITAAGIPAALQKAQRYRVLNDSSAAESICLDVLAVQPDNVEAQVMYVLALTDQFAHTHAAGLARAQEAVRNLRDAYKNAYYNGIVCERWAKAILERGIPRAAAMAYDWLMRGLAYYEQAEHMRPAGNDEAILRWNTCVRLLDRDAALRPADDEAFEPISNE